MPFDRNELRPATTPAFLKWVELGTDDSAHRRDDDPQNDFTLENVFTDPVSTAICA